MMDDRDGGNNEEINREFEEEAKKAFENVVGSAQKSTDEFEDEEFADAFEQPQGSCFGRQDLSVKDGPSLVSCF